MRSSSSGKSLVDGRNEPLARKPLARPGALRRIREAIGDPELAFILPFCMTADELQLAVELGLPIYGSDPSLNRLGTKKGSRGSSPTKAFRTRRASRWTRRAICPRRSGSFGVGALRQRARS